MKSSRIFVEVQMGVKNLMNHKLRSLLTMLGIVFGVCSVISMLAVGEGANQDVMQQIQKLGSNNIIINTIKPIESETSKEVLARMNVYGLKYADHTRIKDSFVHITQAVPVKIVRNEAQLGSRTLDIRVLGVTPDWFDLVKRNLIAGRTLTGSDLETHSKIVVLTEYGARRLLAAEESIGAHLRIGGVVFEVAGIVQSEGSQGSNVQTPDQQIDAYMPINVARNRFGDVTLKRTAGAEIREKVELHQIIVQVDRLENVESAAAGIEYVLDRFHKQSDYQINVPLALLNQARQTKRTFNIVLGTIAGISLLVGGIGIMNIMLAAVTERTREIGVRRAIGAKRKQIIRQFLIETITLSVSGGLVGAMVGVLIPKAITHFANMPTVITIESLILSIGISLSVGIIFGLYPAIRAANLDPIIALRHE
ncbi:MAG: ABC transporter permease [Candidatus Hinthialibacter antarcticus]|nr:ABC transporter permease [Candidatus Hinthialibacter antarcticus]